MKFLADENFPYPSVHALRAVELDVASIQEIAPSIADANVIAVAQQTERTILTFDRDFGELIFRDRLRPPARVVYFRALDYRPTEPAFWLMALLTSNAELSFHRRFTTPTPEMSRQREY